MRNMIISVLVTTLWTDMQIPTPWNYSQKKRALFTASMRLNHPHKPIFACGRQLSQTTMRLSRYARPQKTVELEPISALKAEKM